MSEGPINLNKARKARGKIKKRAQADENAVKFGRSTADKARDAAEVHAFKTKIESHKRET
ncbi:MAG: DUF4169 family protein [Pseudomonadota bacterium]